MSKYQHNKGQIMDNALEALLFDPLFRQRIEKNKKGKGSYQRKAKHSKTKYSENGYQGAGENRLLISLVSSASC